jgi:hypothetical protein
MTDRSERRAEPFKSDECVNCHHPEGLHGHGGCNWQPPFEYAAETCGCRNFGSKASELTRETVNAALRAPLPVYQHTAQCPHCGGGWPHAPGSKCTAKPCETCGGPPAYADAVKSVRCTNCWEVEHRLADYVRSLGGIRFASRLIADALCKMAGVL